MTHCCQHHQDKWRTWRDRKDGRFSVLVFVCSFKIFFWCRGEGRIWENWEVSRVKVHDVKFQRISKHFILKKNLQIYKNSPQVSELCMCVGHLLLGMVSLSEILLEKTALLPSVWERTRYHITWSWLMGPAGGHAILIQCSLGFLGSLPFQAVRAVPQM